MTTEAGNNDGRNRASAADRTAPLRCAPDHTRPPESGMTAFTRLLDG